MKFFLFAIVFCCVVSNSLFAAKTAYVIDVVHVPLRSSPKASSHVVSYLSTGDITSVSSGDIEVDEYVKVEINKDGKDLVGWFPSRFLVKEKIASLKIEGLQTQLARSKDLLAEQNLQLQQLKSTIANQAAQLDAARKDSSQLGSQLEQLKEIAEEPLQWHEQLQKLEIEKKLLAEQLATTKESLSNLEADKRNEGIKLGLLAVGLGAFAGFILPNVSLRRSRKSSIRLPR